MLAHPLWEDSFTCSLSELELKGQRQGITQTKALRSLPIEHKTSLIRHALANGLPSPSHAEAKRLARLWGITRYRARPDFQRPSIRQWNALARAVSLRLATRHQLYKEAQSALYSAHQGLPLACSLAACRKPSLREDACQEARLALLEAIDRIDPEQPFEAYARQRIKRRIQNYIMKEAVPVKAPINLISKTFRSQPDGNLLLEKAIRDGVVRLDDTHAGGPMLARELHCDSDLAPDQIAVSADESAKVAEALLQLTDKQREVIELRFGLNDSATPQSLSQIAQHTGISRQQVFQREKRALQKLSSALAELQNERTTIATRAGGY
ncbi:RNA polymerase sigma factor, sigma-70 family [Verrucomicrobiia bacterium DG1235]|nr:RNA polymerase sigma factor, sigma-70 family [Verrucomicrobiae bacterium DG1235]